MPPRIRIPTPQLASSSAQYVCRQCRHASVVAAPATTPAPPIEAGLRSAGPPIERYPPLQPPAHKRPEFRKTQLHRQYQSLLRSSPLMLIFQHNNLKSTEFMSIRREVAVALRKVDEELAKNGNKDYAGAEVKLQVVQTGLFASALRVVEFWNPKYKLEELAYQEATDKQVTRRSRPVHGLSKAAWRAGKRSRTTHGLEPLLSGPIAVVTLPSVSPQHLKAILCIMAPNADFPAPKRKANPSYHEPAVQNGLQKLLLLGARIEGKAFDLEGARWVGGVQGGLGGLRGQLVAMLSGVGAGITNALSAASTSLYMTMEGRRMMLEGKAKPKSEGEAK